ncbi:MAG: PilZ domain-containing protein [Gammaproteobacteria bacterium]|nr:PilZ domain-containing protein [Gammaproteobacteria bacterium]
MIQKMGEQRKSKRFSSQGNLQSEIIVSVDYPELAGKNIACESVNISAQGIQIILKQHVPVDTVLDLWISVDKNQQKSFHLQAKVCWIKRTQDELNYQAGLDISVTDNKELQQWAALGLDT